jgi:hypothetical protein
MAKNTGLWAKNFDALALSKADTVRNALDNPAFFGKMGDDLDINALKKAMGDGVPPAIADDMMTAIRALDSSDPTALAAHLRRLSGKIDDSLVANRAFFSSIADDTVPVNALGQRIDDVGRRLDSYNIPNQSQSITNASNQITITGDVNITINNAKAATQGVWDSLPFYVKGIATASAVTALILIGWTTGMFDWLADQAEAVVNGIVSAAEDIYDAALSAAEWAIDNGPGILGSIGDFFMDYIGYIVGVIVAIIAIPVGWWLYTKYRANRQQNASIENQEAQARWNNVQAAQAGVVS